MTNPAYGKPTRENPHYSDFSENPVVADYGPKRSEEEKPAQKIAAEEDRLMSIIRERQVENGRFIAKPSGNLTPEAIQAIKGTIEQMNATVPPETETLSDPFSSSVVEFDRLQDWIHSTMVEKGFWEDNRSDGESIALMHSELSELLEGLRKGTAKKPDEHCPDFTNEEIEVADEIVRCLDYAGRKGLRVGAALVAKMRYNETRARRHGKAF